jgi:hypothetical protein
MTDRELMQQALEALEEINKLSIGENAICLPAEIDGAMDAMRQALETKREWVGLTDEEIQDLSHLSQKIDEGNAAWFDRWGFARAIEAKLREKNL